MDITLNDLYLFRGLDAAALAKIDGIGESKWYAADESVFAQGEVATAFYVIQQGSVRIELEDEEGVRVNIATLGTGSHFGEMALLDYEPRSAHAVAEADTRLLEISYALMGGLLENNPDIAVHVYRELSRFLCSRLRLTTLDLGFSRSQNISLF